MRSPVYYVCDCGKRFDISREVDYAGWVERHYQPKNFVTPLNEQKGKRKKGIRVPDQEKVYKNMLLKSGVRFRDHVLPKNLLDKVLKYEQEQVR